jgi:acyl dehydratase
VEITQDRVDRFADATGDHQWIHVDPERAKHGPFGTTIAHGYLTLSITNQFLPALLRVPSATMGLNYGANRVRFPAPVPVGSRIRMGAEIIDVQDVPGGVQVATRNTVEIEGGEKPACVVEALSRFLF